MSQSSHNTEPWMQGMEKTCHWAGPYKSQISGGFILPTAFLVITSENSKIIQSEKSQMSQWYGIIASYFPLSV